MTQSASKWGLIMPSTFSICVLGIGLCLAAGGSAPDDKLVLVAGGGISEGGRLATDVKLESPFGVDFDKAGNLYLVEMTGQRLRKMDAQRVLTTVAGTGQ